MPVEIVGSIAGDVSSTPGTTHNMGSFDVGSSDANKKCLLGITTKDVSSHLITGVTLGGVALTEIVILQHNAGPYYLNAAIWGADISSKSGSQAIVVTLDTATDDVGASGVAIHKMNSMTPSDTAIGSVAGGVNVVLANLSGPAGGIVIGASGNGDRTFTASWSSLAEQADVQTDVQSEDHRHTAAWSIGGRSSSNETITWSSGGQGVGAAASFR